MERDPETPITPTVTKVGGGMSARLGVLLVAGVLAAVVWVGVSSRSNVPVPVAPLQPPVAVASQASHSPSPVARPTAAPASVPPAVGAVHRNEIFGVSTVLGLNQFITILVEHEPGHLTGSLIIPVPPPATEGTFVFEQLSSPLVPVQPEAVGSWPVNLDELLASAGKKVVVLEKSVTADPAAANSPVPVMHGYRVTVVGRSGAPSTATLEIDVHVAPELGPIAVYPRARGLYNRCRWDVAPYSGHPGTIETDC